MSALVSSIVDVALGLPLLPFHNHPYCVMDKWKWQDVPKTDGCRFLEGVRLKPENLVFEHYHEFAEKIAPRLRAALAGEGEVPQQAAFSEAWLGYALFCDKTLVSLEEVIGLADAINHSVPNADEVGWAFLRLRKRGWLVVEGDLYGLTAEGRRSITTVVAQGNVVGLVSKVRRLRDWISAHPPPGKE